MSWVDIFSYWRCPNCDHENEYNLTWQHFYKFKELPDDEYSKETCKNCGKEYYVDSTEPSPFVFRMNRGLCKNDYVKDMVLDVNKNLTIVGECFTT